MCIFPYPISQRTASAVSIGMAEWNTPTVLHRTTSLHPGVELSTLDPFIAYILVRFSNWRPYTFHTLVSTQAFFPLFIQVHARLILSLMLNFP
jgi:hypothetical protein